MNIYVFILCIDMFMFSSKVHKTSITYHKVQSLTTFFYQSPTWPPQQLDVSIRHYVEVWVGFCRTKQKNESYVLWKLSGMEIKKRKLNYLEDDFSKRFIAKFWHKFILDLFSCITNKNDRVKESSEQIKQKNKSSVTISSTEAETAQIG